MFDTMTMTKVIGGICGTFLVFLLGGWFAEVVYHSGSGGHGDEHAAAYVIEAEEGGEGDGEAEEGPAFEELFAAADPANGEGLFRACQSCHSVAEGEHGTGPSLYGVVGRTVDGTDFGGYSGALEEVADVWTPENLNHFIENPRGFAPGTAMGYNGMRRPTDRADLIAYLDSLDG